MKLTFNHGMALLVVLILLCAGEAIRSYRHEHTGTGGSVPIVPMVPNALLCSGTRAYSHCTNFSLDSPIFVGGVVL